MTSSKHKSNLRVQSENEPTSRVSSADPVRVGDAGDGKDVCSEEETSWDHTQFVHVAGPRWAVFVPLSRLKRGGTLRRQWREPLSSVPSSKCQPAGGSVRTSISLHKLVMGRLVYSSSRRDLFFSSPGGVVRSRIFFFFVHIHYNSDKLGQTHADGALISSPCSGFPFLPDSDWSKAPPILAITLLSGGQNSGAEHARSHRFPTLRAQGVFWEKACCFWQQ